MNKFHLVYVVSIALLALSFNFKPTFDVQPGIYGSSESSKGIQLKLNPDYTFMYSHQGDLIKGNWEGEKGQVLLTNYPTKNQLPNKWKINKSANCIKSKKGLMFMRLCLQGACD